MQYNSAQNNVLEEALKQAIPIPLKGYNPENVDCLPTPRHIYNI